MHVNNTHDGTPHDVWTLTPQVQPSVDGTELQVPGRACGTSRPWGISLDGSVQFPVTEVRGGGVRAAGWLFLQHEQGGFRA